MSAAVTAGVGASAGVGVRVVLNEDEVILFNGDSRIALKELPDACVDAVVTDPPYELGFMGKSWDASSIAYDAGLWREVLRVLKPGGHMLAFGGTRTYHRMACAIEDAGFEIRDSLHWIYGSGFPKSLDVAKAIDKDAGHWRGRAGGVVSANPAMSGANLERTPKGDPVTAAAAAWSGWGTALKPTHEPIVLARKPLAKGLTVAANVQTFGTGALNIDASRIGDEIVGWGGGGGRGASDDSTWNSETSGLKAGEPRPVAGRWPVNILFDEDAAAELDAHTGTLKSGAVKQGTKQTTSLSPARGKMNGYELAPTPGSEGGASRFFYCAKTSRSERDKGLDHLTPRTGGEATDREEGTAGLANPRAGAGRTGGARNFHPTVKPQALMRWCVQLITPPGGVVLDPFTGSGSTLVAARALGHKAIGVELTEDYLPIITGRLGFRLPPADEEAA